MSRTATRSLKYIWDDTVGANPVSGSLRANQGDLTTASQINISDDDRNAKPQTEALDMHAGIVGTSRGLIHIIDEDDRQNYVYY